MPDIDIPPPNPQALLHAMQNDNSDTVDTGTYLAKTQKTTATNLAATDLNTLLKSQRDDSEKSYDQSRIDNLVASDPTMISPDVVENFWGILDRIATAAKLTQQAIYVQDNPTAAGAVAQANQGPQPSSKGGNPWFNPSVMAAIAKYLDQMAVSTMNAALKEGLLAITFFNMMAETAKDVRDLYLSQAQLESKKIMTQAYGAFAQAGVSFGSAAATIGQSAYNTRKYNNMKDNDPEIQAQKKNRSNEEAEETKANRDATISKTRLQEIDEQLGPPNTSSKTESHALDAKDPKLASELRVERKQVENQLAEQSQKATNAHANQKAADEKIARREQEIDAEKNNKISTNNQIVQSFQSGASSLSSGIQKTFESSLELEAGTAGAMARYLDTFKDMYNTLYSNSREAQKTLQDEFASLMQLWIKIADTNKESFTIRSH